MKSKKALVVGISGQDGSYLARFLLNKGYEVYGTSRDAQVTLFSNLLFLEIREKVTVLSMAINDFRSVLQVINEVEPDEIYNLAGQTSVGLSFAQPVETMESIAVGTLNMLEAIRFYGRPIKLYNASSSECYGDTGDVAADESMTFKPCSPYAVAKASAFWLVNNYRKAYEMFACSGILFNHESPLRPSRFVTKKIVETACRIAKGSNEKLTLGNVDIWRDWGWAPEYVEAMWLMLQNEAPDDYVIATGESNSLQDFVVAVFASLDLDWREHVVTDSSLHRPVDIERSCGNAEKAQRVLGWTAQYKMRNVAELMVKHEMNILKQVPS